MGTYTFVAVRDRVLLERVERLAQLVLRDVDQVCSRFRSDSDLSVVNAHPGRWVAVDPLLVAGVAVAVDAAAETDGLVHPLLGRHLVQLGYDRDFDALVDLGGSPFGTPPPDPRAWEQIELDPGGAIRIPDDTALDLGATGKAWAADLVATAIERDLDTPAIVSVGGDVRIAGPGSWPVAVSERPGSDPDVVVTLDGGGLATSSTQVRRWSRAGTRLHHLLDPRTGRPAREVWRTVTTTGPTCTAANAASTAAVVLGTDAPAWLAARQVTARLVGSDGQVVTTAGWPSDEDAA
ncbi:thiamine biosynthesis lipoprotein [Nocardioides sp. BE266]|nr:thiamine biosynthesis lipoprotein [Nocardioides sp. BE266]